MNNILNPQLLKAATEYSGRAKHSFMDAATTAGAGADPAAAGGGAGGPMAGPMPPMPPMDPAAAGGAGGEVPPDTGGGIDPMLIRSIVQEVMAATGGGAGGAGGAGGEKKMKVDVNQEIYQVKKLLVMIAEAMELPIPASMLLGDPAQDPHVPPEQAAQDPMSSAAQNSAIQPIQPMGAASPALAGGGGGGAEQAKAAYTQDIEIHRGHAVSTPSSLENMSKSARGTLALLNRRRQAAA